MARFNSLVIHLYSIGLLSIGLFAPRAQAEIADLRSSAREIRFALVDHGRLLNLPERKAVRRNLALSFLTLEKLAQRRSAPIPPPGRSLISLSVALERLVEAIPPGQLAPSAQSQILRQLGQASSILQRKNE